MTLYIQSTIRMGSKILDYGYNNKKSLSALRSLA